MTEEPRNASRGVLRAIAGVIGAAFKLSPVPVVAGVLLTVAFAAVLYLSVSPMVGVVIAVVLITTIALYVKTQQYGEASLAFVAGLLTAFAVPWTPGAFAAFLAAWLGFTLFVVLASILSQRRRLLIMYTHAAGLQTNDETAIRELAKRLEAIGKKSTPRGMLPPDERAEVIRLLVFRQVAVDLIPSALATIETIHVGTMVDLMRVTNFVADMLKIGATEAISGRKLAISRVVAMMRQSPVPPDEFFSAFENSRSLMLSGTMDVMHYFEQLKMALEAGHSPDEVKDVLRREAYPSTTTRSKKWVQDHSGPIGDHLDT